jgi:hypothetical protein
MSSLVSPAIFIDQPMARMRKAYPAPRLQYIGTLTLELTAILQK